MNRRGLLALLMMPMGQATTWISGDRITLSSTQKWENNWSITLPDKLTIATKDGWSKSFTHDELKRILTDEAK